jgi:hypothetical protein
MKYEFEVLEIDLDDRKKIIAMKEELRRRINELSDFGQNTLVNEISRLKNDLERCESEWVLCQRERAINKLSEVLNANRASLSEMYVHDED